MLNVFKYYDNPEELDRYSLNRGLELLKLHVNWEAFDSNKIADLDPIKHIIMKDPELAYSYADKILHHRWLEAEPYIMKEPKYAYFYAARVMKGRWEEAEQYIKNDKWSWRDYVAYFKI